MEKSYRIINKDTGKHRFVGKQIYENKQLLDQMGFMQQDIQQPEKEIENIEDESIEEFSDIANELPKRGRKPKQK